MMRNKSTILCIIVLLLSLFVFVSCATVGHEFPTNSVAQIQNGTTTKTDIHKMFGAPWRTGMEDGEQTWTYGYYKYRLLGETTTRDLKIRYDSNDIVTSYSFNTSYVEE